MKTCLALLLVAPLPVAAATHTCPADLGAWKKLLGAEWIDCHQVADLTTTGNPYTDPQSLTGMGFPPPGSGTLNSKYTQPTTSPVSGLQIDGYFPDACNAFQVEPALTAKDGTPFIPGCTPPPTVGQTCLADCHHDAQFVIRIPDDWDGHLLTTGTPGIRDAFSSDFIFSDYALEKGWAYVSQDKGNMGANFFRAGSDEAALGGGRSRAAAESHHPAPAGRDARRPGQRLQSAVRRYRKVASRISTGSILPAVLPWG